MSRRGETQYYVHLRREARWTIRGVFEDEGQAVANARALVAASECDAVKVVREHARFADKDVFFAAAPAGGKVLSLGQVDAVPCCAALNDFYRYEGARAAGRLLRRYLDDRLLTPWELLHGSAQMRQLLLDERLFDILVRRVVTAQIPAELGRRALLQRSTELYDAAEGMRRRPLRLGDLPVYVAALRGNGFAALLDKVGCDIAPDDRDFYCRAAVAAILAGQGSWAGKAQALLDLADAGPVGPTATFLDEAMALLLDGAAALKEVLGPRATLGDSLTTIVRVAAGSSEGGGAPLVAALARAMGSHDLHLTRSVLLERVRRALAGSRPLGQSGGRSERTTFVRLVQELVERGMLTGAVAMGEALGRRAQLVFGRDGEDLSLGAALSEVLRLLPSKQMRARYLLELSSTGLNARHEAVMLDCFADFLRQLTADAEQQCDPEQRADIQQTVISIESELRSGRLAPSWAAMLARETARLLGGAPT